MKALKFYMTWPKLYSKLVASCSGVWACSTQPGCCCVRQNTRELQGRRIHNGWARPWGILRNERYKIRAFPQTGDDGVSMLWRGTQAESSVMGPRYRNWQGNCRSQEMVFGLSKSRVPQAWASTVLGETCAYSMNIWNLPVYSNFSVLKFLFFYSIFNFSMFLSNGFEIMTQKSEKETSWDWSPRGLDTDSMGRKGKIKGSAWVSGCVLMLAELGKRDNLGKDDLILG